MNPTSLEICKRIQTHINQKYQVPSLKVPFAWMEGCVAWYHAENHIRQPSLDNLQDLLEFVTKQWLLVDFVELRLRLLPPDLENKKIATLTGNHLLQLMYIINIGQSAYSQHLKITQGQESNAEVSADQRIPSKWEPKGRRMLQAHLSDGTQTIKAVEYQPVPQLNLDLIPGTKFLLKGPVECRRGVVLLRTHNLELVGGEVKSLVQTNAPENILARIIGKPENPNPVYGGYTAQTAPRDVEIDDGDEFMSSGVSCKKGNTSLQQPTNSGSQKRAGNDTYHPYPPAKKSQLDRPLPPPLPSQQNMFPDDDDDILLSATIPMEVEMKQEMPSVTSSTARFAPTTDAKMSDKPRPVGISSEGPTSYHPPQPTETATSSQSVAQPTLLRQSRSPVVRPFTYLVTHLKQRALPGQGRPETVCVKGFVSTIRTKLEVQRGRWRLGATINDGSAALDVEFSPEILEKMIGYTPQALKLMMSTKEESAKHQGNQALENAKQSLIRLNCLIHIRWTTSQGAPTGCSSSSSGTSSTPSEMPVVFRLEEIQRSHLEQLQVL